MPTSKMLMRVDNIATVIVTYNRIKIYRSTTYDGTYTAISSMVTLESGRTHYDYVDGDAPALGCWYKRSFYNTVSLVESALSSPFQGDLVISLQDVRNEGLEVGELSNDRALSLSYGWQSWFEKKCGQCFTPRELDLLVDGDGSRTLHLNVPVISVTELYINNDFVNVLDPSYYTVYNRRFPEDDRRNPRIKLSRSTDSIFSYISGSTFLAGDQNQKISGLFGYVEDDGSPPFPVMRAILILIRMTASHMNDDEVDQLRIGRATEEVTDRHRIRYSDLYDSLKKWSVTGITEVDDALVMYRRPAKIRSPRSFIV